MLKEKNIKPQGKKWRARSRPEASSCKRAQPSRLPAAPWAPPEDPPSPSEGGKRTGSVLKAGLHLWPDCGLGALCPVSMDTTYQLENQGPGRKSPRALHRLKEYPNCLCDKIESYILLCLLGYRHKNYLGLRHMNHRLTLYLFFSFVQTTFREFG